MSEYVQKKWYPEHNATTSQTSKIIVCQERTNGMGCLPLERAEFIKEMLQIPHV